MGIDCAGQPIKKGDVIAHADKMGLWFGYFVGIKRGRLHYVIISNGSSFQTDITDNFADGVHADISYGASSHKVINITKSEIGQTIKQSNSYRNIQSSDKWK